MDANDVMSGAAWRSFCDRMAAAGDRILAPDFPASERDRLFGKSSPGIAIAGPEAEEAQRLLQKSGLPPTQRPSHIRYCLYDGDTPRVVCKMREVVGQVLTHTLPDSEPALSAHGGGPRTR